MLGRVFPQIEAQTAVQLTVTLSEGTPVPRRPAPPCALRMRAITEFRSTVE